MPMVRNPRVIQELLRHANLEVTIDSYQGKLAASVAPANLRGTLSIWTRRVIRTTMNVEVFGRNRYLISSSEIVCFQSGRRS